MAENAVLQALSSRGSSEKLKRFAEKFHPRRTYESFEALLEDPDVDAVYIPLPNGLHCEWVLRAAGKKKHVLFEKPLGVSAEEVRRMKAACNENGVLLMEAFAYRQSPLTKKAKSIVESGALGTGQCRSHRGSLKANSHLSFESFSFNQIPSSAGTVSAIG